MYLYIENSLEKMDKLYEQYRKAINDYVKSPSKANKVKVFNAYKSFGTVRNNVHQKIRDDLCRGE